MSERAPISPRLLAALIPCLAFASLVVAPDVVHWALLGEDGPVEWTGALAWMSASVLFVVMLRRRPVQENAVKLAAPWLVGLALMTFLAAGEEISWGQRLFDYRTPEAVSRINLQNEMNLHNLAAFDVRTAPDGTKKTGLARWLTFGRLGSLVWMGFLIVLPIAYRHVGLARRLIIRMRLPVPPLEVAVAGIALYAAFSAVLLLADASVAAAPRLVQVSANELKETAVAVLFFATTLHLLRGRSTRPVRTGSSTPHLPT